jgi:BolA protein
MSIKVQIESEIMKLLDPTVLEVVNESNQHNVPANSETHFKLLIVSENFVNLRKVARHQKIYTALASQLAGPVHALALHTYTPQEWQQRQAAAPQSPNCMGGSKGDHSE